MKVIPKEIRDFRKCYFCGASNISANQIAYELSVDEAAIPEPERDKLGGSVYCCEHCYKKMSHRP